jgi:hypothetical protein
VPDRSQFGEQHAQAGRGGLGVVRRRDDLIVGRGPLFALHGAGHRRRHGSSLGIFCFEQHVGRHEAARLRHVAEDLLAGLERTRAQEFGQHHQDRGRPCIAAPRQVAPPALACDHQAGFVHQVLDHRNEFFRRVVAQEMVDARGIEPPLLHQPRVFMDADVEQVRQQPDVLPQRERAGRLGLAPGGEVEMAALPVFGEAELHAHRVVAREGPLVDPLEAQPHAGSRGRPAAIAEQ